MRLAFSLFFFWWVEYEPPKGDDWLLFKSSSTCSQRENCRFAVTGQCLRSYFGNVSTEVYKLYRLALASFAESFNTWLSTTTTRSPHHGHLIQLWNVLASQQKSKQAGRRAKKNMSKHEDTKQKPRIYTVGRGGRGGEEEEEEEQKACLCSRLPIPKKPRKHPGNLTAAPHVRLTRQLGPHGVDNNPAPLPRPPPSPT